MVELKEYELEEIAPGRYLYCMVLSTLHPDEASAKRRVTARIAEDGLGPTITAMDGSQIPGRAWAYTEAPVMDVVIRAGDLAAVQEGLDDTSNMAFPPPADPDDPIPPDDDDD